MCPKSISRILYPTRRISVICLSDLPSRYIHQRWIQASSLQARVYMVLQPTRFTQIPITREARELLPHVFTLTCMCRGTYIGVLFSVALSDIAEAKPPVSWGVVL